MSRRLIAAAVLASLLGWSVPLAQAWSWLDARMAQKAAPSSSSAAHDHSCCPGVHPQLVPPIFVKPAPADMPCSQHPCCAKQAPDNPASLPAVTRILRSQSEGLPVAFPGEGSRDRAMIPAGTLESDPFQAYFVRSMVLRI